jgi:hypothetical protein
VFPFPVEASLIGSPTPHVLVPKALVYLDGRSRSYSGY